MELKCYKCQAQLDIDTRHSISRSEECPKCFANIRCCRMCTHYDSTAYNECREPTADRILEKEKANFCDHYQIGSGDLYKSKKDDLKSIADALFKK